MKNPYLLAALLLLLGSCTVYAPTTPATPLVTKGQVEVTAGLRELVALEAGAAWSPAPHLLLTAEGAVQNRSEGSSTTNNVTTSTYQDYHRQAGLGLGYYRAAPGPAGYYLAATGGVGWADVNLHDVKLGTVLFILPFPVPNGFYEARYRRYYGQLYAARPLGEVVTGGLSLRGTWVDYTRLTVDGYPIAPAARFFLEPTLFFRFGHGPLQASAALGWSLPVAPDPGNPTTSATAPTSGLFGLGLVLRPHLLGRGRQ